MSRLWLTLVAACLFSAAPVRAEEGEAAEPPASAPEETWVAVHRATGLWSNGGDSAESTLFRLADPGARFQVALPQEGARIYVWDPTSTNYAYIDAQDVGPIDPGAEALVIAPTEPAIAPPAEPPAAVAPEPRYIWSGTARVTMYTCVELGGCNRTASGIWPYEGVVAVDPRVIPLGSTVWLDGLGHFLAADTGSAVYGNRIDVFVHDYHRAIRWGVRYLNAAAFRK
jgi:3D (Asp-Asp-Asp) domain-containing protein